MRRRNFLGRVGAVGAGGTAFSGNGIATRSDESRDNVAVRGGNQNSEVDPYNGNS